MKKGDVARTEMTVFKGTALSIVKDFIRREIDAFNNKFNVNSRVVATNNSDVKISTIFGQDFGFVTLSSQDDNLMPFSPLLLPVIICPRWACHHDDDDSHLPQNIC